MDELHTESRAEEFYRALAGPEKKKSKYFRTNKKEVERALKEGKKIPAEAKKLLLQRSLNGKTRVVGNVDFDFGNVSYKEGQATKKRTLKLHTKDNSKTTEEKQEVAEEVTAVQEEKREESEERIGDNVFSMMLGEDMEVVDITRLSDGEKLLQDGDISKIGTKVTVVIAEKSLIPEEFHAAHSKAGKIKAEDMKISGEKPPETLAMETEKLAEESGKQELKEKDKEDDSGR